MPGSQTILICAELAEQYQEQLLESWNDFFRGRQPGIAPLEHRLGIVAGAATPALADEAARWQADLPQQQTRTILKQRHGVSWADATLRKVVAAGGRTL